MPTIELISIDCDVVPNLPEYSSFNYIVESKLESHRGLFQSLFDSLSGTIVHLGNKNLEATEECAWFAGGLMDWKYEEALVFLPSSLQDIEDLMNKLIKLSPQQKIVFSTDYQFGGLRQECGEMTLSKFFELHDQKKTPIQ